MTLYGFPDGKPATYSLTLSVSGVGPRLAMAALAVHDARRRQVLADGNVAALTRVPGIGKRGAERWCWNYDKAGELPWRRTLDQR